MSDYGYRREAVRAQLNGTVANNLTLAKILVPAQRSITLFGLKAMITTLPTAGTASVVNLLDFAGNSFGSGIFVNVSAGANSVANSAFTFPWTFSNSLTTDTFLQLRLSGATAGTDSCVQADFSSAGIKGKPV